MLNEENLYARFISGELSEEEISELKASGDWDKLQAVVEATENWTLPAMDLEENFEALKSRRQGSKNGRSIRMMTIISGIAACLLIAITMVWLWDNSETYNALAAETITVNYPDNFTALLNAGSELEVRGKSKRTLELEGEAFFDVEKGTTFEVETETGIVRVLGTQFNIRAWDDHLEVTCYEGEVAVMSDAVTQNLTQGMGLKISPLGAVDQVITNATSPDWISGTSSFNNMPLDYVLKALERQFKVSVSNDVNRNPNFSGSFGHESLISALDEIILPLGLNATISSDSTSVIISN